MQSQGGLSDVGLQERFKRFAYAKWESLSDSQKISAKKVWGVITYKWRWQIAMNIPYLVIFVLDSTVPAIHKFDMALLSSIATRIPLPSFISSWIRLG